ncbi:MAG: sugar-binding domain-containing protein [Christensenella sp.]|nr:sugar-binding domain-containing protein [Christensenella sp.]
MIGSYTDRRDLLIRVAKLYYLENKSQQEIADEIFTTRSNVSRLLSECVKQHIIEFRINDTSSEELELQKRLKKTFGLKGAIVVPSTENREATKRKLGEAVVSLLRHELKNGMTLGVSWGTTLYCIASAFRPVRELSVDVVQLVGGMESKSIDTDGGEVTRRFARALGGDAYLACFPYIVRTRELHDMLLMEPEILSHMQRAASVNIALVGMGVPNGSFSSAIRAGYFSEDDIKTLADSSSVADICGIQINGSGKPCAEKISGRIMGISFGALKKVPSVIGVSTGKEKKEAICASLLSGLIDIAALDADAAYAVLGETD